jgi:hypothetical protein
MEPYQPTKRMHYWFSLRRFRPICEMALAARSRHKSGPLVAIGSNNVTTPGVFRTLSSNLRGPSGGQILSRIGMGPEPPGGQTARVFGARIFLKFEFLPERSTRPLGPSAHSQAGGPPSSDPSQPHFTDYPLIGLEGSRSPEIARKLAAYLNSAG